MYIQCRCTQTGCFVSSLESPIRFVFPPLNLKFREVSQSKLKWNLTMTSAVLHLKSSNGTTAQLQLLHSKSFSAPGCGWDMRSADHVGIQVSCAVSHDHFWESSIPQPVWKGFWKYQQNISRHVVAIPIPAQVVDEHLWECFATLDLGNIPALADDVVFVIVVAWTDAWE